MTFTNVDHFRSHHGEIYYTHTYWFVLNCLRIHCGAKESENIYRST